jgi:tetratricopeptide (TPR) repeat protein
MKNCVDRTGRWPSTSAEVSSDEMDDFLAHAEVCSYHAEVLQKEFEEELRSMLRLTRGLDEKGRLLSGDELQNAVAEQERRASEWQVAGSMESPLSLIALYNGGRLIAGSGEFRNYTYEQALHDLDPRAGLQLRARCSRDKDDEVLLGFYPLEGVHHEGEELLLPLDNGYTVGLKVEQIGERSFDVQFRCVENSIVEGPFPTLSQAGATMQSRLFVLNEPLRGDEGISEEVGRLILEIRCLAKQQRYDEALCLAEEAVRLAPGYWRARINLGTMLVMSGELDDGEKIFQQVLKDCSDNPKAVAAALHNRAWVKEICCEVNDSANIFPEVVSLYEEALELDDSLVDTRASLLFSLMSNEAKQDGGLLEDSLLREGFFDALRYECAERARREPAKVHKFLQALPARVRNLVSSIGQSYAEEYSY